VAFFSRDSTSVIFSFYCCLNLFYSIGKKRGEQGKQDCLKHSKSLEYTQICVKTSVLIRIRHDCSNGFFRLISASL